MDLDEAITVAKIDIAQIGPGYLTVGWQTKSFEMYLYVKDTILKGRFSHNRLIGFSRNLQMTEKEYYDNIKQCLSQNKLDYLYELKSGFFYWKRKLKNSILLEGFLPVELDTLPKSAQPDLIEVLIALNGHLRSKYNRLKSQLENIEQEYQKFLKDTEDFFSLKIELEKALCDKFLNLLDTKKSNVINRSDTLNCVENMKLKQILE